MNKIPLTTLAAMAHVACGKLSRRRQQKLASFEAEYFEIKVIYGR